MSKFYVTTSIPYVNADPHIGFAMELLQADVLARHARQQGDDVIFSTGTDEHGGKIIEKAEEAKLSPKQYVDKISQNFRSLDELINASNNRFVRTTDEDHEKRAQLIWKALEEDIYKNKYVGWYCTGDEAFFTETEVKATNGICPNHNRPYEKIEEDNYFFKLSKYESQIIQAIEDGSFKIVPVSRRHEILSLIKGGLEDISISRPKDKISWGIPVPGDATQVIYVWFEALMNYITVLGYPDKQDFKAFWPANVQIVGKDIIRFHAAIWPAMLIGLGLKPPKQLFVHGFITLDGKKISKSVGNVVHPKEIINKYGVDGFRYYFLRHIPSYEDGDFSWERMEDAYNNELANDLGNAVSRTTALISKHLGGKIKTVELAGHDIDAYTQYLNDCRFDKAMDHVWDQVRGLNQFIDQEKPWEIVKDDIEHFREIIEHMVSSLLLIASLLIPMLPGTAEKIQNIFKGEVIAPPAKSLFPKQEKTDA